jgi:alpha-beta hydrolase superfamily lysophospholipase
MCRDAGVKKVDLKLYPQNRHEILNELDRQTVYEDLLRWMEEIIG